MKSRITNELLNYSEKPNWFPAKYYNKVYTETTFGDDDVIVVERPIAVKYNILL